MFWGHKLCPQLGVAYRWRVRRLRSVCPVINCCWLPRAHFSLYEGAHFRYAVYTCAFSILPSRLYLVFIWGFLGYRFLSKNTASVLPPAFSPEFTDIAREQKALG